MGEVNGKTERRELERLVPTGLGPHAVGTCLSKPGSLQNGISVEGLWKML